MQATMDRLERLVSRRRRLVLGLWLALLIVVRAAGRPADVEPSPAAASRSPARSPRRCPTRWPASRARSPRRSRSSSTTAAATRRRWPRRSTRSRTRASRTSRACARRRRRWTPPATPPSRSSSCRSWSPRRRDDCVDEASQIRLNLDIGEEGAAVPLHIVGQGGLWAGMQELSKQDLEEAEFVGLPLVLIILLAVFGSLAAAALPLALGVAAVTVTGAIVFLLAQVMEMSIFVTNMASMLGIGVAVDYSLFILARYREELRAGRSAAEARAAAMRTSGMAVVFSGVTVVVALAGPVPDQRQGRGLDGDRRDRRRRGRGARRRHAAAGADRAARPPRLRAGQDRRPAAPAARAAHRPRLLGALDERADEAPAAVRDRRHRADAADRRCPASRCSSARARSRSSRRTSRPARASTWRRRARAGPGAMGPIQMLDRLRLASPSTSRRWRRSRRSWRSSPAWRRSRRR